MGLRSQTYLWPDKREVQVVSDGWKRIVALSNLRHRDSLGDAGFQKILDSLFSIIRNEKTKHIKATSQSARNGAELRLSASSAAFRVVAEAAATRIKRKTAIILLDHVVDTVLVRNAGLFSPIRNDYMKVFLGLLQKPSLREHLRPQEWEGFVDFILEALDYHSVDDDSQSNGISSRDASVDALTESRVSLRVSQASRGRTSRSNANSHIEELLISLKLLTSTNNAALTAKSDLIINSCLNYLNSATRFQEPALEVLNNVFPSVLTDNIAVARAAAYRSIPIMRRMWLTKIGSLKDQLLIFLMQARDLFRSGSDESSESDADLLKDMFATISLDYRRRQERDCLQMDDVYFPESTEPFPLRTLTLAPVRESPRSLSNWITVGVLAALVSTIHGRHRISAAPEDTEATPRKRQKIEDPLEELVRHAHNSPVQERLYAIQTLLFVFEECEDVEEYLVQHTLELAAGLSNEDDSVANWSMLLISR
jgi:serine-protein kinase ATM